MLTFNSVRVRSLAALCLVACLQAGCGGDEPQASAGRDIVPLSSGWRFHFGDAPPDVIEADFDDSAWQSVSVPHSWNRVGYYKDDDRDHVHAPDTLDTRQGIGWYRQVLTVPADVGDKRVWLEFDAASRTAEVWLNGVRLGEHRGGFSRFRFDATVALRAGQPNLLVVKTDNTKPEAGSSTADVLPIAGDFFVHGGLYRPVRLVLTDPLHIDMQDFGGPGVYATTTSLSGDRAEFAVRVLLRNDSGQHSDFELVVELIDDAGDVVARSQEDLALGAGTGLQQTVSLELDKPRLWQGVIDPYLYTLRAELRAPGVGVLDRLDQQYGIRAMEFDPDRGFLLNGNAVPLRGVGYHQDREGKGWAVSPEDIEEDVAILREMGANTIRLAHYQHGQPVHEFANRTGLVLWDEIGLVTAWSYGPEYADTNEALVANARLQLIELIRQNYNHPSVAVWGIANEVDFGALLPRFLGAPATAAPDPLPVLEELAALAASEDPSRPSTLANCCEANGAMGFSDIPVTAPAADLGAANRYFGWYYSNPGALGPHLDNLHDLRPGQPLSVSEYGAGGAVSMHTDDPLGGPVDPRGESQPEEYMSYVHASSWEVLRSRPWLWGIWIWNGFDFATTIRREGDSIDINTKGLVTYDRKVRKDSYFFYKANWSELPAVHIASRRYTERAYPVTDVNVFSNAPATELLINGESLGLRTHCHLAVCTWKSVALAAGSNALQALGRSDSGTTSDSVQWHLDASLENVYRIDSGTLMAAHSETARFGSDAFFDGGEAGSVDKAGGWGQPPEITPIANTANRELLATYREGDFSYRLPLADGEYTLTLNFVEPSAAPGERTFDVLANGELVLARFDVAAKAGSTLTAVTERATVQVDSGILELDFKPVSGKALVSAISVESAARK